MKHIYVILVSIVLFEIFRILKFKSLLNKYLILINKIIKSFQRKNISDHWLQKFLINASYRLLIHSLKILVYAISLIIIFYIFYNVNNQLFKFFISIKGFVLVTLTLIIYPLLRKLINAKL